jgi:hypothetical protein
MGTASRAQTREARDAKRPSPTETTVSGRQLSHAYQPVANAKATNITNPTAAPNSSAPADHSQNSLKLVGPAFGACRDDFNDLTNPDGK